MATEVTVVIPYSSDCPHRLAARDRVLAWYVERFPAWALLVSASSHPDNWCKARLVMPAVKRAPDGIVVAADADVTCEGLAAAVTAVEAGTAWAVPHDRVVRLAADGHSHAERPYAPMIGGGIVVAHRDVLLDAPLDARFTGWGQEDECWGRALSCLYGKPWQGHADLVHFWHPPQERLSRGIGSDAGMALRRRYRKARNDPQAMRELLQEAR